MQKTTNWLAYFDHVGFDAHDDLDRFAAYLDLIEWEPNGDRGIAELAEREADQFIGEYEYPVEYVQQLVQDAYNYEITALPAWITNHIDYSEIWRSELSYDHYTADTPAGNVWIWHMH
jgi:hypothetical protein